ncbi:MFS transporter [Rhodococcus opacus]|uniref:MFS transporter n=1 Tax=Rhodococcus opacus TaxID=37919 RepID=UPI00155AD7B3|nr:MFS transporter [Rhodococcus opacus]
MSGPHSTGEPIIIRSARDVTNLVNSGIAKGGNARAITFIALGGIFIDAYDFSAIAFGLHDIARTYQLGPVGEGIVACSIMVGALIGALVGGYLVDRLGRYKLFMADMIFFVIAALVCALAPNVEILTAGRFVMGVGIGIDFPVALAFIAEFTRSARKGGQVTLWQPMWYLATASSFLVLLPLYFIVPESAHDNLWRWAVGFGAVPALAVMLVRHRYMDESPSWAANQGDLERAAAILEKSYGLKVHLDPDAPRELPSGDKPKFGDFRRLFTRRYRQRTILAATVSACQSMQYYAVGFALPGIIIGFLAQDRLTSIVGALAFNVLFGITGGFLGVKLAGKWGSWKLSTIGFGICLAALVGLGLIGTPSSTTMLIGAAALLGAFVFAHAAGPGAQGMTMATLSYPTSLRGVGSGFSQALLRIGSTVALLFFPILGAHLGTGVYLVVALAPTLGLLTLLLIRWEPIGQDVDADDDPAPQSNSSNSSATTEAVGATGSATTDSRPAGLPLSKEMQ